MLITCLQKWMIVYCYSCKTCLHLTAMVSYCFLISAWRRWSLLYCALWKLYLKQIAVQLLKKINSMNYLTVLSLLHTIKMDGYTATLSRMANIYGSYRGYKVNSSSRHIRNKESTHTLTVRYRDNVSNTTNCAQIEEKNTSHWLAYYTICCLTKTQQIYFDKMAKTTW